MIDNVRVTLQTVDGRKVTLDLQPRVAHELATALLKEVGEAVEKAVAGFVKPRRTRARGALKCRSS